MTTTLAASLEGRRVGIVLSSAFFGFYAHTGFMQALATTRTKGHVYAGSSAGALVAAFSATHELDNFLPVLLNLRRKDFWDPSVKLARNWGLLKGHRFQSLLESHLPISRFEECATPLLTVSTNLSSGTRHVDSKGPLAPAIAASCALPFLFQPVSRGTERYADGGIIDKAPIQAVIDRFQIDALVVHIVHSRTIGTRAPLAPRRFLNWSLDACRHASWQTQALLAEARGVATYIVETEPSSIGPFSMSRGGHILEETRLKVTHQLQQPARYFRANYLFENDNV